MHPMRLITALLLIMLLAACGAENTPDPTTPPTVLGPNDRVLTPLPPAPSWRQPAEAITRDNVAQAELLGRLDTFGTPSTLFSFDFSPDGTSLLALDNERIVGWDLITGQRTITTTRDGEASIYYAPDKTEFYATDTNGLVGIYGEDGAYINDFLAHPEFNGETAYYDGGESGLLALGGLDGTVKVWDMAERRSLVTFEAHELGVNELAFSTDGTLLATAFDDEVKIWDWRARTLLSTLDTNNVVVRRMTFSPDNRRLALGTSRYIALWTVPDGVFVASTPLQTGLVDVLMYAPDGRYIIAGGDSPDMLVIQAETGEVAARLPGIGGNVASAAFSPDGELLLAAVLDGPVTLWDMTQITDETVQRATLDVGTDRVLDVAFTTDGFLMLFFDAIGPVYVWGIPEAGA
ncbi:MAG: hypothetical protein OHK0046_14370 [Anaerolineae bacterium]